MKILFNNENKRFRIDVNNLDGLEVLNPSDVQMIQVHLNYTLKKDKWLEYRYPAEAGYSEVTLKDGKFYFEITTEQAGTGKSGQVELIVNLRVNDVNFSEGFKSFTRKGIILKIHEV